MHPKVSLAFSEGFQQVDQSALRDTTRFASYIPWEVYCYQGEAGEVVHEAQPSFGVQMGLLQIQAESSFKFHFCIEENAILLYYSVIGDLSFHIESYDSTASFQEGMQLGTPLPVGKHHVHIFQGQYVGYYFIFSPDFLKMVLPDMPTLAILQKPPIFHLSLSPTEVAFLQRDLDLLSIIRNYTRPGIRFHHYLQSKFYLLLQMYADRLERYRVRPAYQSSNTLMSAIDYVQEHYHTPGLNQAMIANAIHVSVEGLQKALHRSELRLSDYINSLRTWEACRLLENTSLSIGEIALQLGFYDQAHFTSVFKRKRGKTPSQHRAMHKDKKKSRI